MMHMPPASDNRVGKYVDKMLSNQGLGGDKFLLCQINYWT